MYSPIFTRLKVGIYNMRELLGPEEICIRKSILKMFLKTPINFFQQGQVGIDPPIRLIAVIMV